MSGPFVQASNLRRVFDVSKPWLNRVLEGGHPEYLKAVDGVTFAINKGETFALVGESGSGKTTVARMIVGLLPPSSGQVLIDGVSMTDPRQAPARRRLRRRIQMIFQDPYASLNPRFRVDAIIAEPIRAFDLIQGERDIHARVGVMYLGRIVEIAEGRELFAQPRMPYTKMLLGAVPDLAMSGRQRIPVKGEIPNPIDPPPGCAFNPRCPLAFDLCRKQSPELINGVACHAVNTAPVPA